jgi:hypothetical protein
MEYFEEVMVLLHLNIWKLRGTLAIIVRLQSDGLKGKLMVLSHGRKQN